MYHINNQRDTSHFYHKILIIMQKINNTSPLTTIGIGMQTSKLIDKLCKRYSLKKGEIVRLAFTYIDKACINPAEAPESVKAELAKINKRQDDIIRFIRHYEEQQLNPMIRVSHSIAVKFEDTVKQLNELVFEEIELSRELQKNVLIKITENFGQYADVINNQGKRINLLYQKQQRDNKKLLEILSLYAELSACGMMETRKKENLKDKIITLIENQ